ncbi:threonine ammonia-lyase [Halalkalibaculum roseum]|uniref:threonine ammonia-lyase n=1 Tax=Halalkalibaculum roseum TaxID=2709311 RepID=UPI002011828A|nr:pyridoxal-phosphate dependent enzyme [Halalkalibaculum roseum]
MNLPTLSDIQQAESRIREAVHRTPVLRSRQVDERTGCRVYFKCENFQRVGAFKFRGASNAVFSLSEEDSKNGVATHSSGNHAQAIALAAKMKNIPAYIVMPENSPEVKKRAVAGYGAEITFCEPTQQAREETLEKVVENTGSTFIHPYNDPRIIAGQGTSALELLQDYPDTEIILAPVGGGGLASGTAIAACGMKPEVKVIGCEPEIADDAYLSFKTGELQPSKNTQTVADGLRTGLGELTFACLQKHLHSIVTVSEEEIVSAMRYIWERMNIIIEASCAVPVAALFNDKIEDVKGKNVAIIITGGNVDLDHLPWE